MMKLHNRQIHAFVFLMVTICLGFGLGCAQTKYWDKPGASNQDFNMDNYACMQEAQQPDSTMYVNIYGGYSASRMRTNVGLYEVCMNAKGWYLQSQQQPTASTKAVPTPGSSEEYFNKAKTVCFSNNCNDPQRAVEYLNEAIRLKPDLPEAYNNRGFAYSRLKQYQFAIKDYDKAISLKAGNAVSYYNRGIAYENLGNLNQAIEDYKTAARMGYKTAEDYLRRQGIDW